MPVVANIGLEISVATAWSVVALYLLIRFPVWKCRSPSADPTLFSMPTWKWDYAYECTSPLPAAKILSTPIT